MTRRVMVTGAGGLIGRKVVDLLRFDCAPIAMLRNAKGALAGVETVVADLGDPNFASRLPSNADAVVHLAQAAEFSGFPKHACRVFQINVAAMVTLLNWARTAGVRHFVHASTGGIYGRSADAFREDDPVRLEGPLSFYFGTKHAAEVLAQPYGNWFSVAALRFFFVYGPGQKPNMLIPRLVKSIGEGKPVTLSGPDGMRLNPIHVDDAAAATVAALHLGGNAVVNVGGAEILSIRDIAGIIGEQLESPPRFQVSVEPERGNIIGDISRMKALLHCPKVRFRDGIGELVRATHA